ncbi:MAG: glycosyltransferase [Verrucomicrobia bacterium]|nr:glycosyltransferase [Verrucomicrobiota bacterium]
MDARTPQLRALFIHAALTPYRIDLLNHLHRHLELKAIFLRMNPASQAFDQAELRSRLECDHEYLLRGFEIGGRLFRRGVLPAIETFDPDVVVTQEYSPTTLSLALLGRRILGRRWGLTILTADSSLIAGDAGYARKLARRIALGAADSVIVYTDAGKTWLVDQGVPANRVFVSPNCQDEKRFATALDDALPLAEQFLVKKGLHGRRIVLCVGRLVELKGVDRVIGAFARVARTVPDTLLVVVGDGPERRALEQLATREGVADRVRFEGQQQGRDLLAWYLLGRLLVLASRWECYGAVVNEALLAGTPVLCSKAAGAAELIRSGHNGHVFDPYDLNVLSDHMAHWLQAAAPLGVQPLKCRESLMPYPFEEAAHPFIQAIEVAAMASRGICEVTHS